MGDYAGQFEELVLVPRVLTSPVVYSHTLFFLGRELLEIIWNPNLCIFLDPFGPTQNYLQ